MKVWTIFLIISLTIVMILSYGIWEEDQLNKECALEKAEVVCNNNNATFSNWIRTPHSLQAVIKCKTDDHFVIESYFLNDTDLKECTIKRGKN